MQAQGLQGLEDLADARHALALHGRYGDTTIGHLTPGEMVLPRPIADDPVLKRQLFDAFERHELNPYQYQVGHFENSINPLTGVPEFGFFKKIGKFLKKAAPTIGQVVGFAIGGPTGAAIGGGIGGAIKHGNIKGAAKAAAVGYIGGKMAQGFGVEGGGGIESLWGQGSNPSGSIWKLGPAAPGTGGVGGLFQDIGASGANMLRGAAATGLPSDFKGTVGESWKDLSGLQKVGIGGLALAAAGGLGSGKNDSQMPGPSGELGGYLQNPLSAAALPTQYGTQGVGVGGPGGMAMSSGIAGGALDPATEAYLKATLGDEEYSNLMFPEFARVSMSRGGALIAAPEAQPSLSQPSLSQPIFQEPVQRGLSYPYGGGGQSDVMGALRPVGDFIKGRLNVDEINPTLQDFAQTINTKFPDNSTPGPFDSIMSGGGGQLPSEIPRPFENRAGGSPHQLLQVMGGFKPTMFGEGGMMGDTPVRLADGGQMPKQDLDLREHGGSINDPKGSGDEDTVRALLADGEFVMTKQAVAGMGDGDHDKGIAHLYAMMGMNENKAQQMGLGRA